MADDSVSDRMVHSCIKELADLSFRDRRPRGGFGNEVVRSLFGV